MSGTAARASAAPSWLEIWPVAYPHTSRLWTVRSQTNWGVLEPESLTAKVVNPAADRRLPGLAQALRTGSLVGYRIERRAIVRSEQGYVKVLRPGRVAGVVAVHRRLSTTDAAIRIPRVIRFSTDGRIQLEALPGLSIHNTIRSQRMMQLSIPIERVADALACLHRISPTVEPDELCNASFEAADAPQRWAMMVGRAEPKTGDGLLRIAERLPVRPPGRPALIHGDLHDKNIMVCGRSVGLIDLDGVQAGVAEDELANLGVHLQLRCLQSGRPIAVGQALAGRLYRRYSGNRAISEARVDAAARHTWFRLACLYHFRLASRPLVPRLLDLAVGN